MADSLYYKTIHKFEEHINIFKGLNYLRAFDKNSFIVESNTLITLWNMNIKHQKIIELDKLSIISSVFKLPNGHSVFTASPRLIILDENFKCIKTYKHWACDKLLLLPSGKIAMNINNYEIVILDCDNDYSVINKINNAHSHYISCLVNISNNRFASSSYDSSIKIWSVESFTCSTVLVENEDYIDCLAFVDKFDLLISGGWDKRIMVYDMTDYKCVKVIQAHDDRITCLLPLPGGFFASGSNDKTIKIWNFSDFKCVNILKGHEFRITSLLHVEDNRIVSAAFNEIIFWSC
jgi:WD40 repeat protein